MVTAPTRRTVVRNMTEHGLLDRLIRLGSRASKVDLPSPVGELVPGHPRSWGEDERPLSPPLGLLEWLVQNISAEAVAKSGTSEETVQKRLALARSDPDVLQDALTRLRAGKRGKKWFVFEGPSSPDAYLETDSIVVVVEGKRTEPTTTSHTTFMPKRSQLIRHIDAAWEVADGRTSITLHGMNIPFDNTYAQLPERFFAKQEPARVPEYLGSKF